MELFTGRILFPTSNTYEHLLMMEKVTKTTFPKSMIEPMKNKEAKILFNSSPNSTGSYLKKVGELKEYVDISGVEKLSTIEVAWIDFPGYH